jgi:histidinol phosphatase-like enzyme
MYVIVRAKDRDLQAADRLTCALNCLFFRKSLVSFAGSLRRKKKKDWQVLAETGALSLSVFSLIRPCHFHG